MKTTPIDVYVIFIDDLKIESYGEIELIVQEIVPLINKGKRENSLRDSINTLEGFHCQVMSDLYRYLVLGNFTWFDNKRGKKAKDSLDKHYPDHGTLPNFEIKSETYNAAGMVVYNILRCQEKYEYVVLASLLVSLLQAKILDTPQIHKSLETYGKLSLPEEIKHNEVLPEGARYQITINAYERNSKARQKCIEYYGANCIICGFNFSKAYGKVAEDYIHVHHLTPLSEINEQYEVNPITDLRPVCPNCHAVIHRRKIPYSIEEVTSFLHTKNE